MKPEPLRILFVTHVPNMAGANRSMFQLIKELKDFYHCFIVVIGPACPDDALIRKKFQEIDVRYIDAPIEFFKKPYPHPWKSFVKHLAFLWRNRHFHKSLLQFNFNIVHSNSSVIDCGAWISKQLHCVHVWHLREFGDIDYNYYPLGGRLYERYVYRKAKAYIAISMAVKEHFYNKIPSRKIHLIYNGVSPVKRNLWTKHKNDKVEFLCAGIINETKNQMEIIMAIDELVNKRGVKDFHLTLLGLPNLDYTHKIQLYAKEKRITDFITILSESDGIQEIASGMDVGIVPSRAEAFGRVTVEYMLQNLLVIANNQGANTEIINDGETGFIYPAKNVHALAQKMQEIINNRQLLRQISQNGNQFARKHFLSIYNTKGVYALYQQLVSE